MRVLFVSYPEKTIFQYLAPLVWALRTAGHEVRFASQPHFSPVINQAGLTAQPVGRDHDPWRMAEMDRDAVEAERAGLPAPYDVADAPEKATWDHLLPAYAQAVAMWHKMENFPMMADLVAFAKAWRPDLVIWEPTTFAGAVAAKACGAAHGRLLYSLDVFGVARQHFLRVKGARADDPLAEWLGRYTGGFTEDLAVGQFTIDQFPESLTIQADLTYLRTQYIPYGGPAVVPGWLTRPPERPRVALTMGLSATERYNGYTIRLPDVLDALADLDIELVATIADSERAKLTSVPANARIVPYVPLHALAPTCAAVIHHAGLATLATVSRYALPQLALHWHFDQPALARRLAAQGAGIEVGCGVATGEIVRESVLKLLADPSYAERARALRAEIASSPAPNGLVPRLEELARSR
ncbi:activator-dependent family glycosyltransferase [Herbidospora galbida]|uniref:Activator-dependent family glycosyltransferase n=1 Tax=Herbidospora galbida TaxID=2575442 RepID=A0A4U3LTE0_9ACTN|nr:activator-dependent family glycosyltransferase [Herbidospora galbida]TKK79070.1 activator-dependent family glycosyltransferase [Herbidospora galbida]